MLSKRKILVHSVEDGDVASDKYEDLMITNIKLQIADQAQKQELEAAKRSLRAKRNAGYLTAGVGCFGLESIGYQKVGVKPNELKVVRFIYDQYPGGNCRVSFFSIHLHSLGFPRGSTTGS